MPTIYNKVTAGGHTLIDLSQDTVTSAAHIVSGHTGHLADGTQVTGTGGGGGGGATQHTIHLEFSDSTDTDIEVDYDDALIGTMITAYQPTGDWLYNNKIVDSAALDSVTWYTRPTATWEVLLEGNIHINPGNPYGDIWISDLGSVSIPVGSVWRITIDGDSYVVTATGNGTWSSPYNGIIGNPLFMGETDDGSDVPLCFEQNPWGAWSGAANAELSDDTDHTVKIERQVTA